MAEDLSPDEVLARLGQADQAPAGGGAPSPDETLARLVQIHQAEAQERAQKLEAAHQKSERMGPLDTLATWVSHGEMLPFGSALFAKRAADYQEAAKRYSAGAPKEPDYKTIADFETVQRMKQRIGESLPLTAMHAVGQVPALLGEFKLGGAVARPLAGATGALAGRVAAPVLGRLGPGVAAAAGKAGSLGLETAALTAAAPSTYLDRAVQKNLEAGRPVMDLRGLTPAYALGLVQMGVLQGVQTAVAKALPSGAGWGSPEFLQQVAAGAGGGVIGSAVADVVASSVGLDTGFGTVGQILGAPQEDGKPGTPQGALKKVITEALTFAAFSAAHYRPRPVVPAVAEAMKAAAPEGPTAAAVAGAKVVQEAKAAPAEAPAPAPEAPPAPQAPPAAPPAPEAAPGEAPLAPLPPLGKNPWQGYETLPVGRLGPRLPVGKLEPRLPAAPGVEEVTGGQRTEQVGGAAEGAENPALQEQAGGHDAPGAGTVPAGGPAAEGNAPEARAAGGPGPGPAPAVEQRTGAGEAGAGRRPRPVGGVRRFGKGQGQDYLRARAASLGAPTDLGGEGGKAGLVYGAEWGGPVPELTRFRSDAGLQRGDVGMLEFLARVGEGKTFRWSDQTKAGDRVRNAFEEQGFIGAVEGQPGVWEVLADPRAALAELVKGGLTQAGALEVIATGTEPGSANLTDLARAGLGMEKARQEIIHEGETVREAGKGGEPGAETAVGPARPGGLPGETGPRPGDAAGAGAGGPPGPGGAAEGDVGRGAAGAAGRAGGGGGGRGAAADAGPPGQDAGGGKEAPGAAALEPGGVRARGRLGPGRPGNLGVFGPRRGEEPPGYRASGSEPVSRAELDALQARHDSGEKIPPSEIEAFTRRLLGEAPVPEVAEGVTKESQTTAKGWAKRRETIRTRQSEMPAELSDLLTRAVRDGVINETAERHFRLLWEAGSRRQAEERGPGVSGQAIALSADRAARRMAAAYPDEFGKVTGFEDAKQRWVEFQAGALAGATPEEGEATIHARGAGAPASRDLERSRQRRAWLAEQAAMQDAIDLAEGVHVPRKPGPGRGSSERYNLTGPEGAPAPAPVPPEREPALATLAEEMLRDASGPGEPPPPGKLEQLKAWLNNAWGHVQNGFAEMSGRMFPRLHELSTRVGEAFGYFVSHPAYARELTPQMIDRVLGPGTSPETAQRWGATFAEDRLRRIRDVNMAEARAQAEIAGNYRRQADDLGATYADKQKFGRLAREATEASEEALQKARAVGSLVGKDKGFAQEADYQAATRDPEYRAMLERWKAHMAPFMGEHYRLGMGMEEGETIDNRTQIPGLPMNLKPLGENEKPSETHVLTRAFAKGGGEEAGRTGPGGRGAWESQKLRKPLFAREATGAARGYETDLREMIGHSVREGLRVSTKAEMLRRLEAARGAEFGRRGQRVQIDGQETIEIPGVNPPKGTQEAEPGETSLYVVKQYYPEVRKALAPDQPNRFPTLQAVNAVLTKSSLASTVEAAYHSRNLLSMIFRPYVMSNFVGAFRDAWRSDARFNETLTELARVGAPAKPEARPEEHFGGTYNPAYWLQSFLHVVDRGMRVAAKRAFDQMRADGLPVDSEANLRDFVNQLGQYNIKAQHGLVALLRDTGIGPFATAGTQAAANGLRSLALDPGVQPATPEARLKLRALYLRNMATVLGVSAFANYWLWGNLLGDDQTPLGAVKIDESGDLPRTTSVDLTDFLPLKRGLRSVGALAMLEGLRDVPHGPRDTTPIDRAVGDIFHSLAHPAMGPPVSFAWTAATGRDTLGRHVARKAEPGGTQAGYNALAALEHGNPFWAAVSGATHPEQEVPLEERAAGLLGPYGPKYRYVKGYQRPPR